MKNVSDLISSVDYRLRRYKSYNSTVNMLNDNLNSIKFELGAKKSELETIQQAAVYYKKSQDILYEKSIGALKNLINSALGYVFHDKNYEIDIQIDDKRSVKNLTFYLKDLDKDFEVSLKNGCGNGVRATISAILKLFILINKGHDVLILDEKYSFISESYIENFFIFLTRLAEEKQLKIILITHDTRFISFAGDMYKVVDGKVCNITSIKGKLVLVDKLIK